MKATDLMIGDWVTGKKWIEKPFHLTRITEAFCYGRTASGSVVGPFFFEEIVPIPITPEILKKNGWFYPGNYIPWMKMGNPYRELWGCSHSDGTFWLYASGDCDKDESFAEIRYVHELQHALKICGIEKEVVL